MLGYRRHDATSFINREQWFQNDAQYLHDESFATSSEGVLHADDCSYADTGTSLRPSSWSEWAHFHGHVAVVGLS